MFKEYYAISDSREKRFIIMQDDVTGEFAVLKTVKPEIIDCLKNIDFKNTNLPRIYEFGADYIVEEHIEGIKLPERVEDGIVSLEEIKSIIFDICEGVKELHRAGLAHMDICCENIIVSEKCYIVIDYSASVKLGERINGSSYGTPMFYSPEHFGFDIVTKASDVYSVGKLLEFLLQVNLSEQQTKYDAARAKPENQGIDDWDEDELK